jgi:hypothetical protein
MNYDCLELSHLNTSVNLDSISWDYFPHKPINAPHQGRNVFFEANDLCIPTRPMLHCVRFPFASSSSVLFGSVGNVHDLAFPLGSSCISGSQPQAKSAPKAITTAKPPRGPLRLEGSTPLSASCTRIEPSLPNAAEMPWQVQRYLVGNISAGIYKRQL